MASVFDQIAKKAGRKKAANTEEARKWFRQVAKNFTITPGKLMSQGQGRMSSDPRVGHMYAFFYDPKHKETLPYYDKFPLIFMVGPAEGGFLGMNFHYLPFKHRAILMDALYDIASDNRYDERTKLRINYNVLKSASKFRQFKPTLKHYLTSHVKSGFLEIYSNEWDMAIMLPVAKFTKANARTVWRDSLNAF